MSNDLRPEVINAGAEVIAAATAYVEGRQAILSNVAIMPLYRRLETAVIDFKESTRGA
jgi:hypothetical protein